jgi:hypothetical protein
MPAIFPTAYFGNISYFRKMCSSPRIEIESKEHFIKQTLRSRCEILSANGVQKLSVPVVKIHGSKTATGDVEISHATDWRKDHWKAIESAYASSPYFDHYGMEVKALVYNEERNLILFNLAITKCMLSWLAIDINFTLTSTYEPSLHVYDFQNKVGEVKTETVKPYIQVFSNSNTFVPDLSLLDLIFCEGPLARNWII